MRPQLIHSYQQGAICSFEDTHETATSSSRSNLGTDLRWVREQTRRSEFEVRPHTFKNTLHYNTIQNITIPYKALQYITMHYNALHLYIHGGVSNGFRTPGRGPGGAATTRELLEQRDAEQLVQCRFCGLFYWFRSCDAAHLPEGPGRKVNAAERSQGAAQSIFSTNDDCYR